MGKSRSHTDQVAIFQHAFNEELGALEVIIVGGQIPEIKMGDVNQSLVVDTSKMEAQLQALIDETRADRKINPPVVAAPMKDVQVIYVDKIIVQEKIVQVDKEVIREIPGPTRIEVVTVEKEVPIIVAKTEYKDLSKLLIAAVALQGLINIIVTLVHK